MAKPSSAVWECRTAGGSFNGAGFDSGLAGSTGVDYSQQDSPQLAVTDAANTGNTALTSVTGGFTPQMVGNAVCLQGNGWWFITAYVSATQVTLDSNGPNASGMTARVGGAYLISNNSLGFGPVSGNKVWIKSGTYLLSVNGVSTGVGSVTLPVVIEGYNAVRGDIQLNRSLARPILQRNASTINCVIIAGVGQIWRHLELVGTGSTSGTLSFSSAAFNCVAENFKITPDPAANGVEFLGRRNVLRHSYILPQAGAGNGISLQGSENNKVEFCHIKGTPGHTGAGIENFSDGNDVRDCIIEKCGVGVLFNNTVLAHLWLASNRFYKNGTHLKITAGQQGIVCVIPRWNVFSQATTFGADYTPSDLSANAATQEWMNDTWDCNFWYTTATRYHNLPAPTGDTSLTGDPFTNPEAGDFTYNSAAGAGQVVRSGACTVTLGDGTNTTTELPGTSGTTPTTTAFSTAMSLWRELTNEPDSVQIPDSIPTIYVDAGCEALNRRIRYYWKTDAAGVVLVAGTQEYTLPQDLVELRWVQWNGKELTKGNIDEWRNRGDDWRNEPVGEPREWAMYSNQLVFRPAPSAEAVATAASPVLRYCGKPPSVATLAFDQLNTQDFRIPVYYGVAEWSASYPDVAVAQQRVQYYSQKFNEEASVIAVDYADRGVKP